MECVAYDLLCHAKEQGFFDGSKFDFIKGAFGYFLSEGAKHLADLISFIKANLEAIVGIAGFVFGLARWWIHRDKVLHERLEEYLNDQDRRLDNSVQEVLSAMDRPGPIRKLKDPLFAVGPLRKVLRTKKWRPVVAIGDNEAAVDGYLDEAIKKIQNRLETTHKVLVSYNEQKAGAHLIKGALSTARAKLSQSKDKKDDFNNAAVEQFRMAIKVPGQSKNIIANEFLAHQLLRLESLEQAKAAYEKLLAYAEQIPESRTKIIITSRAKRYLAEIAQSNALTNWIDGGVGLQGGSTTARDLISDALLARNEIEPFQRWDLVEQGEMHYMKAFICSRLVNHHLVEEQEIDAAYGCFNRILLNTPAWHWFSGGTTRALRNRAKRGKQAANAARRGSYSEIWLLNQLEQHAANIGDAGRSQSIGQCSS